ncbi:MAG: hypothetical protein V3S73_08660 [Gammaproteobacteria bacterium]|nr:hypothetical protein [Gammaproteobacteria bacterium]
MNATVMRIALILVLVTGLSPSPPAHARIKCWTNKDDVRECGNVVPPEYSQKGHEELSDQGIVIDRKERAKTPEELEEERRLAAIQAEEDRKARKKEIADRVLLDTFASEDDLVLAQDGKLAAIEQTIHVTESRIKKLQKSLNEIMSMAAEMERRGKPPADGTQNEIDVVRAQIAENRAYIKTLHKEQDAVRNAFESDLTRFKELKAAGR